ncbi:MAG: hypothetical protein U0704_02545 [Candidatus Eisenbacteria bacterium]
MTPAARRLRSRLASLLCSALSLAALAFAPGRAAAEGSASLVQSGGYRPFLEYRNDFTQNSTLARKTIVRVYVNAGDTLLLGSSASGVAQGRIRWRRPDGAAFQATSGAGQIATAAQEAAGPRPNAGGYAPLAIPVAAGQAGVWEVFFVSPDSTSNLNPPQVPVANNWSQAGNVGYVCAWDVTVRNGAGVTLPGRAYVNNLAMNMGGPTASLSSQIWLLTRDGFRYRVDVNGAQPFGFNLFANNKGFKGANGLPLYHSVELGGSLVHDPDALDTATDYTHKIFFNTPALDLPASAASPTGSTWLATAPFVATVSNFRFVGVDGTDGQAASGIGGTFSFQSTGTGNYVVRIDLDADGSFTGPVDRALIGVATVGLNSIAWDGLDGLGRRANPTGDPSNVKARVTLLGGEVHFPYIDAENNVNGIVIERQTGAGAPDFTVFYNDVPVGGTASLPPAGENSSSGGHRWSGFLGDVRGMDTWAYVPGATLELETDVIVRDADLELVSKTHSPNPFVAGQTVGWTLVARNNGPDSVYAAVVLDTVDARVSNVTLAGSSHVGGTILGTNVTGQVFRATVDLPPGGTATFELAGSLSPAATGVLLNRALALRGDDQGDADDPLRIGAGNNSKRDTAAVIAAYPDLALDKSHAGATFTLGTVGTWTLAVTNVGNLATSGDVVVRDTMPAGMRVVGAASNDRHWSFATSPDSTILTATYDAPLVVAAATSFTVDALVFEQAVPEVTNFATASTAGDPNPGNDRDSDTVPIAAQTDLALDKSHTGTFRVGNDAVWTFTVSNLGPASSLGTTTVVDTLPAGTTFVSGFGEGWLVTHSAGQVVARYGPTIPPGEQRSFSVTVAVNAAAYPQVTNAAVVVNPTDLNPDNNRDTDTVPVTGLVNLTVDKSHATTPWQSGATGDYTIAVHNAGNIPSTGTITVRDTLPAGLTYAAALPSPTWTISHAAGVVTATTNAAIPAGGNSSFSFTVNVFPAAYPSVTNVATVEGGGDDTPLDNRDEDPTAVLGQPDMALDKSHTGTFTAGSDANWRVFVQNVGNADAVQPVVRDTLPTGVSFVSATNPAWSYVAAGQVVTATYGGTLAPGASSLFTLNVHLANDVATTLTNVAAVNVPGDSDPSNDRDADPASVNLLPDLTLDKSHTGSYTIGGDGVWSVTVRNAGQGPTIGTFTVHDTLPAGVAYVSGTGAGWTFSHTNGVVLAAHAGVLAPGASSAFTLTVNVQAAAYPQVTNVAAVTDGGDVTPDNNRDTDTVPVLGAPNLVMDKRHTQPFVAPGSGTYTMVVTNVGTLPTAGAITVRDTLPAGLTFTSASGAGFTIGAAGAIVTATTNAVIAVGDSAKFDVVVAVAQSAVPGVVNAAVVAGGGDVTPEDNRDVDPTPVSGSPDLLVDKTHPGTFTPGILTNWRIEVRNVGTVATTGATVVRDTLPAGVTFQSANGTGWAFAVAGQVVTATHTTAIAANDTKFFLVNIRPTAQAVPSVTNWATVTTPGDLNPGNDRDSDTAPVNALPDLAVFKRHAGALAVDGTTTYTITVRNVGNGPTFTATTVLDTLPAGVGYLRTVEGDAGWTVASFGHFVSGNYSANLAPGDSAKFSFVATISAAAVPEAVNSVVVSTSGDDNPTNNRALDRGPVEYLALLAVDKTASPSQVQLGDVVSYAVQVRNDGNVPVEDLVVNDRLPAGFVYLPGSALVDGREIADPAGAPGAQLAFAVGHLDAASSLTLRYRVAVGAGANMGRNLNVAVAQSVQRGQTSPPSSAAVEVRAGVFGDEGIIAGKIFVDCDCEHDGTQGHEELGIPGVRLYLEDGTSVLTDVEGKFHFANVRPRTHVLRVDATTLPAGAKLSAANTRHAGDPLSQFVDLYKGELFHVNFAEVSHDPAVLAEVKARRERGEVGGLALVTTTSNADGTQREVNVARGSAGAAEAALAGGVSHDDASGMVTILAADGAGAGSAAVGGPQTITVRVRNADGAVDTAHVRIAGAARPFQLTGVLEGRLDLRNKSDRELGGYGRDRFMDALGDVSADSDSGKVRGAARGALFGTGRMGTLGDLTLRYDTEADPDRRFMRDIRPDDGYDVWGDASLTEFGARSRSRLYARLDRGSSYALFGDLTTPRDAGRQLGAFDRSVNGAQGKLAAGALEVSGFASQGTSHQQVDEIAGLGISGPYALTRADAVMNSERVELVTRDRSQPSRILSRRSMTRFVDYTVEAYTGRLLFRRPVPSVDADLNPVSIRVTYETETTGDAFWLAGGRAALGVGRLHVGGNFTRDDDPAHARDLASVDATLALAPGVSLVAEFARTDSARGGLDRANHDAKRAELTAQRSGATLRAWALRTDAGFDNASAGVEPGREELGGTARVPLGKTASAFATALRTRELTNDGQRQGVEAGLAKALGAHLNAEVAFRGAEETTSPASAATSGATPAETRSLRGRLTASFPRLRKATAFGEFEQDLDVTEQRRGAVGADLPLVQGVRAYLRHENIASFAGPFAMNAAQQQASTVFGFTGENTRDVYGEYRARDAFAGRDAVAAIGLRHRWAVQKGLFLDGAFERLTAIRGGTGEATSAALGAEYTRDPLWKGTARVELRNTGGTDYWFATGGVARKLSRDFTALGRAQWTETSTDDEMRARFGLAYRRTDDDRFDALARWEVARRHPTLTGDYVHEHIASGHAAWQAHRKLALDGQLAARWMVSRQDDFKAHTAVQLAAARARWQFSPPWDAGLAARALTSNHFDEKQFGLGVELGRVLAKNLRGSVGWNVFGFRSAGLAAADVTDAGPYVGFGWKFDETLFGALAKGGDAK